MTNLNFDPIYPKYGLRSNPYFIEALMIEGGTVPIETLVGREREKEELHRIVSLGGGHRCMVVGEAGVGKTSLVNYIRAQAKKASYFSPNDEIGIKDGWKVNDFIINTLQSIYTEIKNRDITISDSKLLNALEDLFELSKITQDAEVSVESLMTINTLKLMELFKKITKEIVNAGYRTIVIQYNNFDNVDDFNYLVRLLNNLRDFFLNPNVIFIFVGDEMLPHIIIFKSALRQIFVIPEIKVPTLSYEDIKNIIKIRMETLKINDKTEVIKPHSEESLRLLYELYKGNIRDILNSLSCSIDGKNAMTLSAIKTKQILIEKAKFMFLNQISPVETRVLYQIISAGSITNGELAEKLKKSRQNISKYLRRLQTLKAIKIDRLDGTKIYYKPTTEAIWLKLKVTEQEISREKNLKNEKLIALQKRVNDFDF